MVFTVDLLKFCCGYGLMYLAWFSMKNTEYKCEKSLMIGLYFLMHYVHFNEFPLSYITQCLKK